jgi:hypothetical protein
MAAVDEITRARVRGMLVNNLDHRYNMELAQYDADLQAFENLLKKQQVHKSLGANYMDKILPQYALFDCLTSYKTIILLDRSSTENKLKTLEMVSSTLRLSTAVLNASTEEEFNAAYVALMGQIETKLTAQRDWARLSEGLVRIVANVLIAAAGLALAASLLAVVVASSPSIGLFALSLFLAEMTALSAIGLLIVGTVVEVNTILDIDENRDSLCDKVKNFTDSSNLFFFSSQQDSLSLFSQEQRLLNHNNG